MTVAGLPAGKPAVDTRQMLFLQPPLQRQALLRATLPANKQQYLWQNTLLNSFTYGCEKVTMQVRTMYVGSQLYVGLCLQQSAGLGQIWIELVALPCHIIRSESLMKWRQAPNVTYSSLPLTLQDGDFGLELLFPPRMHGCFYMHGIYTARMCKDYDQTLQLVRFGVNYTGSTAVLEQCYQFNRDKNQPHCGPAAVLGAAQGHPSACEAGAAARG